MNGPRFLEFLKKLHADVDGPIIVIADGASYDGSGPVKHYLSESQGEVVVEHLPAYCPDLNPRMNKSGIMPRLAWPSDLWPRRRNSKLLYSGSCFPSSVTLS
ncbi:MAG TPA: transposase [Terriglobales bacterium]|nr:transposase [Terriglobales bacterium]